MWTSEQHDIVDTIITAASAIAAGWLFVYRRLEGMIAKRVDARMSEVLQQISDNTTRQLKTMRDEIHQSLTDQHEMTRQETRTVTERLDKLMQALIK